MSKKSWSVYPKGGKAPVALARDGDSDDLMKFSSPGYSYWFTFSAETARDWVEVLQTFIGEEADKKKGTK